MKAPLLFILFSLYIMGTVNAQNVIISELDANTEGSDVLEFIELKTPAPNQSLDGYIVVFFNGNNGDASYYTIDLNGYSTDVNGLFLLGNIDVSPTPSIEFLGNTLQNGVDAIGIYEAEASSFPNGTLATTTNLIDALVYDSYDKAEDTELLNLLGRGQGQQINENENGEFEFHSIQNNGDGTYSVKTPTPGQPNDGSGTPPKYKIIISSTNTEYTEGDEFDISFTSDVTLEEDLTINLAFTNGNFNSSDFSANNQVTIANGSLSNTVTISLVNDTEGEEYEYLKVYCSILPADVVILNNNYTIKIIDDDVLSSSWGTPLNPTYDQVSSTANAAYYNSLTSQKEQGLKDAIQNIIADPNVVRAQNYGDVWAILKEADQDPSNNLSVWLVYTEQGRSKSLQQTGNTSTGMWNREHTYPQSRGGFSGGTSSSINGIDDYMATSADDIQHGHSDAHHLRAADFNANSFRSNKDYGAEYSGPVGNNGSWKGDVARSIFFMALRYNALDVVSGNPSNYTVGELGDLDSLIVWHRQDPPDDFEMNRNNVIYEWQKNRNPFIDLPDLVEYIWGTEIGEYWNSSVGINDSPTEISLSDTLINENLSIGTEVGTLTSTDVDTGDTHTYTLVTGDGDTNNSSFSITGDKLLTGEVFNFETKSSYSIRILTNDSNDGTFSKAFTITVSDVNESPTDISLSDTTINENSLVGTQIGLLTSNDEDSGDTHTYSLVSGEGDTDNSSFSISNYTLKSEEIFNYENDSTYLIRIQADDGNEGILSKSFTITINDLEEFVGIEDYVNEDLKVYPNPVKDKLIVNLGNVDVKVKSIYIYNSDGRMMYSKDNIVPFEIVEIPVYDYPPSIYYLNIITNEGILKRKIMVIR